MAARGYTKFGAFFSVYLRLWKETSFPLLIVCAPTPKRTRVAPRTRTTDLLPMRDEEGVVLPIPGDVAREAGLEERLDVVVSIRREPAEPLPDADRVRVGDERGEPRCIEEDRVCRLRTDPVEPEQLAP